MASHLGMSVRQAMQEIDSREFAGWLAFSRLSPFQPERSDVHAAMRVLSRCGNPGANLNDFMPDWLEASGYKPRPTFEHIKAVLMRAAAAAKGAR